MSFESGNAKLSRYLAKVEEDGAVVEERLEGEEFRSPSVQLRVTPLGDVELLSTHDQLLGGPSGQAYLGCVFPADPAYAPLISREAMKIGRRLAREGVLGRFALDFVTVREAGGAWRVYAIEINLRKGGTTHPFLTLQFLTDGHYDAESAAFTAPSGRHKHFVASDHVESEDYRAFTPDDLFDVLMRRHLHFDQSRQTGVVLHMLAAVAERGRFGLTAVGDSAAEAQAIYERAIAVLDEEARAALGAEGKKGPEGSGPRLQLSRESRLAVARVQRLHPLPHLAEGAVAAVAHPEAHAVVELMAVAAALAPPVDRADVHLVSERVGDAEAGVEVARRTELVVVREERVSARNRHRHATVGFLPRAEDAQAELRSQEMSRPRGRRCSGRARRWPLPRRRSSYSAPGRRCSESTDPGSGRRRKPTV